MVRAIVCLALALQFCDAEDPGPDVDAGPTLGAPDAAIDGGRAAGLDGGSADGGPVGPQVNPEFEGADEADATARCLNNVDDNLDGLSDCEDPSCQSNVPLCCVGRSTPACCTPGAPLATPIDACDPALAIGACSAITAIATPFGTPSPFIEAFTEDGMNTFVPGGGDTDAGLLFLDAIDPRASTVHLAASIAGPSAGHALGNDFLVFGLAESASADPRIAFYVSGARAEYGLVIAGEIVQRWDLENDAFHEYEIALQPGGAIELRRDGSALATASLPILGALRPVIYGRTYNRQPSSPLPVRALTASITTDACDVPSALVPPSGSIALSSGTTWDALTRVGGPSIVRYTDATGDHDRMALEIDGTIYLAERQGAGYTLSSALGAPALFGEVTWAEERLADPVLRWNGTALELWFTAWANDRASVARIEAAAGTEDFVWGDVDIVFGGPFGTASFAEPAPFEIGGVTYLVVRRSEGDGDRLVLYRLDTGEPQEVSVLRSTSADDLFAFDRDEVGAPAVIFAGGAWRLFFAGRRGSRWSIGMLVSPDGLSWREPDLGAFVYDGSHAGFDVLGVRDPHPIVESGVLHLYYAGSDGVRTRIGVATGAVPLQR